VFIATQLNSTEFILTVWTTVDSVCRSWRHVTTYKLTDVINKNTTDLAVRCSTESVEFGWVELSWVVSLKTPLYWNGREWEYALHFRADLYFWACVKCIILQRVVLCFTCSVCWQPIALIVMGVGLYLLLYKGDLLSVVFEMNYIQDSIIIIISCGAAILLLAIFGLVANRLADFRVLAVVSHIISCC